MVAPSVAQQILALAQEGHSHDAIVVALGVTPEEIEQALTVVDGTIEKMIGQTLPPAVSSSVDVKFRSLEQDAFDAMKQIITSGENENARARLVTFVLEQRLGLKKPLVEQALAIAAFNERMKRFQEQQTKMVVDVEEVKTT